MVSLFFPQKMNMKLLYFFRPNVKFTHDVMFVSSWEAHFISATMFPDVDTVKH